MAADRLSQSLQESLLVLLTFSAKAAPIIRNSVEVSLFSTQLFRDVVAAVYQYLDEFKAPPGTHLPDLFDDSLAHLIEGKDEAQGRQYVELFEAVYEQRLKTNEEYVLGQLEKFVRQQTLKRSVIEVSEAIQDGDLDKAEAVMLEGARQRLQVFTPGTRLTDALRAAFAGTVRRDVIPLGIPELDRHHLGPGKGELHLFIGPPKRGKTWWLVHVAKQALLARLLPLVITLELSEEQWGQRMLQALFSISRHKARVPVTRFKTDELGRFMEFEKGQMPGRMSFDDPANKSAVERKLARLHGQDNWVCKQYPARQLTVRKIESYLDMLEQATGYVPDVLVLDYAKYMKIDTKEYRLEYGAVLDELRGLAVSRNMAVVTAAAANREGTKARTLDETHAAEDYSQIFTADTIFTYSQTGPEKALGLARLLVSNTRVADKDGFILLLSQAYQVGQFALDSVLLTDNYWGAIAQASGQDVKGAEA